MNNYFALFQQAETFDLDLTALEQTYRALAAQFHPDKFASASSFDQKQAMMMSATLNEAYRILKNPLDRATYLLKKQGIDADAPEHTHFAPEFLMQQMEWREALMDAKMEHNIPALQQLHHTITQEQNQLQQQLQHAFAQTEYETATNLVRQGRFLDKLQQEITATLP